MAKETADGAPWVRDLRTKVVRRAITISPEVDRLVAERVRAENRSYSGIVEEALRALFRERVA